MLECSTMNDTMALQQLIAIVFLVIVSFIPLSKRIDKGSTKTTEDNSRERTPTISGTVNLLPYQPPKAPSEPRKRMFSSFGDEIDANRISFGIQKSLDSPM